MGLHYILAIGVTNLSVAVALRLLEASANFWARTKPGEREASDSRGMSFLTLAS